MQTAFIQTIHELFKENYRRIIRNAYQSEEDMLNHS